MRWLLRTIKRKSKGNVSHVDEVYEGGVLTIGRSAGQGLFLSDLRVALEHARIRPLKANRFRIESLIASGIRVDGNLEQAAGIGPGSVIEIGQNLLTVVKPPAGYDAAIEISEVVRKDDKAGAQYTNRAFSLKQTRLSKRGLSWILFGLLLVTALAIPVAGHFIPGMGTKLRAMPVPDDGQWSAGTLQAAHHYFGEDCSTCHTKAFQMVQNEACKDCHSATPDHADAEKFGLPELSDTRCAYCHKDHNGLDGLVRTDQKLCQDCHTDLDVRSNQRTTLRNVADFDSNHPEFTVELAGWDADNNYTPRVEPLNSDLLIEDSNLKFPHDVHLDPSGLSAPSGKQVLNCDSCHVAEAGGAKMEPVDFETMCQDCHQLAFDPQAPDRQVVHGKVAEVLYMLDEFYANKALNGGYEDVTAPAVVRQRRRPGTRLNRAESQEALAWARGKARRVGQSLFEGQACSVCHTVNQVSNGGDISWSVEPVRVAGQWFKKAVFTHQKHLTMTCIECHAAESSSSSDDVLMPDIANCRSCHGGEHSRNKLASTCISCHVYHIPASQP